MMIEAVANAPVQLFFSHDHKSVVLRGKYSSLLIGLMGYAAMWVMAWFALPRHWPESIQVATVFVFLIIVAMNIMLMLFSASYAARFERLLRRGYAITMNEQGFFYFALPMIAWSDIQSVRIEFIREGRGNDNPYLCIHVLNRTQAFIASQSWWQIVGMGMRRRESGRLILIPCEDIDLPPSELASLVTNMLHTHPKPVT